MSKIEVVLTEEKVFYIDRAKQGRAACKKCKEKCVAGELRIAKLAPSPSGFGKIKNWYHVDCIFQVFLKQRSTTIRITSCDDVNGWSILASADKNYVLSKISNNELAIAARSELKVSRKQTTPSNKKVALKRSGSKSIEQSVTVSPLNNAEKDYNKDLSFREFRRLVAKFGNNPDSVNVIKTFFMIGGDGNGFKGDMMQWLRLLFPEIRKPTYNLPVIHLIKLFSKIFNIDQAIMNTNLEMISDVGEVIQNCYESNKKYQPAKKSAVSIRQVDEFLNKLTLLPNEDQQIKHFEQFLPRCTSNDLKILIRVIAHDLSTGTTLQQVLETIHPGVYKSYCTSKNLEIAFRIFNEPSATSNSTDVMVPIRPLLSESCKSVKQVLHKCIDGCYAEIKYHGERIQIHKDGSNFKYFSKNLKPISYYKTAQMKHILIKSFPSAKNFIIDCTFVLYKNVGKINKKTEITDNMCIYVFDCLYYNGVSLTSKSINVRKSILKTNLKEISNQVMLLPFEIINDEKQLLPLIDQVLDMDRETIILKNIKSIYDSRIAPCWFTIQRDSLYSGCIIEPLCLIMLGYFNDLKGCVSKMSYFLMGCYDTGRCKYCTVVKVYIDLDTKTYEKLQGELKMVEINRDLSKVPDWLICTKSMVPDFVTNISDNQPVWEIAGSEYITNYNVHTADCITIKHPRILNIQSNKKATEVTLDYVKTSCINSKQLKRTDLSPQTDNNTFIEEKSCKRKRSVSSSCASKLLKVDNKASKPETCLISFETKSHIFQAIKLLVENGGEIEFQDALRSFIDHGGIVLKLENWKDATHILHLEDSIFEQNIRCPKNAHHIIVEWIIDSVDNNALQDFRSYTVRWEPGPKAIA